MAFWGARSILLAIGCVAFFVTAAVAAEEVPLPMPAPRAKTGAVAPVPATSAPAAPSPAAPVRPAEPELPAALPAEPDARLPLERNPSGERDRPRRRGRPQHAASRS